MNICDLQTWQDWIYIHLSQLVILCEGPQQTCLYLRPDVYVCASKLSCCFHVFTFMLFSCASTELIYLQATTQQRRLFKGSTFYLPRFLPWFLSDPFQPVCRHIPHPIPSRSPTQSQLSLFTVFNRWVRFFFNLSSPCSTVQCALTSLSAQLCKAALINHSASVKHCAACEFSRHLRGEYSVRAPCCPVTPAAASSTGPQLLCGQAGSVAGLRSGQLLAATILKTFTISPVNSFHYNTSAFYAQGAGIH